MKGSVRLRILKPILKDLGLPILKPILKDLRLYDGSLEAVAFSTTAGRRLLLDAVAVVGLYDGSEEAVAAKGMRFDGSEERRRLVDALLLLLSTARRLVDAAGGSRFASALREAFGVVVATASRSLSWYSRLNERGRLISSDDSVRA
jgi:hypothetical protein